VGERGKRGREIQKKQDKGLLHKSVISNEQRLQNMSAGDRPEVAFLLDFKKGMSLILPGSSEDEIIPLFP
jgi:hypothetical protein